MTIKLIMAVDRGNSIGWSDGRLPWKLSADMKRFKGLTTGHTVVMGMNTFVSLGRKDGLPSRRNIVLTRKNPLEARGLMGNEVDIISNLDYVVQLNRRESQKNEALLPDDIWIIGGASVYEEALSRNMVDEMVITLVDADSGGDVKMTTDLVSWKLWLLREEKAGRRWLASKSDPVLDGEHYTSTLLLTRAP